MAGATPDRRLPSQSQSTVAADWPVLISRSAKDRRLSWPEWPVTYKDAIPANGRPSQCFSDSTWTNFVEVMLERGPGAE